MGSLKQLSQRLQSLKESGLNDILSSNLNNKERFIIDLNQEQLLDGQQANSTLMPKYSPKSKKINRKGGNSFDLYQDGDLQSRMFMQANGGEMLIGSNDWKASIYDTGTLKPFGLQEKNLILLRESISENVGRQIIKYLKRK